MQHKQTVIGLDIGSANIHIVVGQLVKNGQQLEIVSAHQSPSRGIRKGVIIDRDEFLESLKEGLRPIEKVLTKSRAFIFSNINGTHVVAKSSRGVVAVSRADGEVSDQDVERVLEAARTFSLPPNRQIIHTIPKEFSVDSERGIENPRGMTGVRLEVEALIVESFKPFLRSIEESFDDIKLPVTELIYNPIATAMSTLSKSQRELGSAIVDFGASTINIAIFEEGHILHAKTLPLGSGYITNDLAVGFQLPIEAAEKLKIKYGSASRSLQKKERRIKISSLGVEDEGEISRLKVIEIIEARVQEIFKEIIKELESVDREKLLPAGIVLTGGGAKMPKLTEFAKEVFRLPVSTGYPKYVEGLIEEINDPSYSTAVGLIQWGRKHYALKKGSIDIKYLRSWHNVKEWFKNLLP